jgi:DNA-binding Xre family transcriptional regulator
VIGYEKFHLYLRKIYGFLMLVYMGSQKLLFEIIGQKLSTSQKLVDIVGKILNIEVDSAYQRIDGEIELTITELSRLCIHFNISMDDILNYQSNNIMDKYSPIYMYNMDNYHKFLDSLASLLNSIAQSGNKEVTIMSQDIATVHFYPFLELTVFKIYMWFKNFNNFYLTYDKFVETLNLEQLRTVYKKIAEAYRQIPSSEIWTANTIRSFSYSLHHYSNCFENKDTIAIIGNQLTDLLKGVEYCTEKGEKEYLGKTVPFRMYVSPIDFMSNYMVIKCDELNMVSVKLHPIFSIFISNTSFYEEIEKLINDTTQKSRLLNEASAEERLLFFQNLKDTIK